MTYSYVSVLHISRLDPSHTEVLVLLVLDSFILDSHYTSCISWHIHIIYIKFHPVSKQKKIEKKLKKKRKERFKMAG